MDALGKFTSNGTNQEEQEHNIKHGSVARENEDHFSDADKDNESSYVVNVNMNSYANDDSSNLQFNVKVENKPEEKHIKIHTPSHKSSNKDKVVDDLDNKHIPDDSDEKAKVVLPKESHKEFLNLVSKAQNEESDSAKSDEEVDQFCPDMSPIKIPKLDQNDNIDEFYKELRRQFEENGTLWEDPEFPGDPTLFSRNGELSERFRENFNIEFERVSVDDEAFQFFVYDSTSHNIDYEFKLKRGILNDKFFIGALLMLFKKKEQFFTNLILDYENIRENIRAGFCGFTFFINGEWKNVTVDTKLPYHQTDEMALTSTISAKVSIWVSLFEKAYSKIFKTYDVLNGTLVKDYLVDLTGGWSKLINIQKEKIDDTRKKFYFEEIRRCLGQKYLIGCMKYDETAISENLDDSKSDQEQNEDEQIITNSIYVVLDIQEVEFGIRLIYLVNYWSRGKWTNAYGVDDETWEANKALGERLKYQVSQTDGTFWMSFDDWLVNFNKLYYCRIFPETWSQYCIPGSWSGLTSGGAPPRQETWIPEKLSYPGEKAVAGFSTTKSMNPKFGFTDCRSPSNQFSKENTTSKRQSNQLWHSNQTLQSSNMKMTGLIPVEEGREYNHEFVINPVKDTPKTRVSIFQPSPSIMQSTKKDIAPNVTNLNITLNKTNISGINSTLSNFKNPKLYKEPDDELQQKDTIKRVIIKDTEDRWFLNPQYKVEIKPGTKIIFSLMQEDKKLMNNAYLKCNFMVILCKGRYSRVWDFKEHLLIKKATEDEDGGRNREILIQLDYNEIIRKMNQKNKKMLAKGENIQFNIVPYIEYYSKYEIEKKGTSRIFKIYSQEALFWLKVFSSEDIYINELQRPFECAVSSQWMKEYSAGGARYVKDEKKNNKIVENPYWPVNPQYLFKFESNIQMKIILRKTAGYFSNEEAHVGLIITKPSIAEDMNSSSKTNFKMRNDVITRNDQIVRVMESTNRILENRRHQNEEIYPKLTFNASEYVVESTYSNPYCASLFMNYNRIDSPVIIIPTLESPEAHYDYELKIYSNRQGELHSLNTEECKLLISEWNEKNAGGCHLIEDEKKVTKNDERHYGKKSLSWLDNPKFHLLLDLRDKMTSVEFEIVICRSDTLWRKKIAHSVINSMIGVYIFKYDKDKWMENCLNYKKIEFMPKNEISFHFVDSKFNQTGYIIMPATYGPNVYGPFSILIKCKAKFNFSPFDVKSTK